jgi:methylaspartate ammonia-lyase
MKVSKIITSPGLGGFYFDDLEAIRQGAKLDGAVYTGLKPITPGFTALRQRGESVSIMIALEDGQLAYGDCVAVQYSGTAGRDPVFRSEELIPIIEQEVAPRLVGRELVDFKALAEELDEIEINGRPMHSAIRYGVTQAILDAISKAGKKTMAEVVAKAYGLKVSSKIIPIFSQSGEERYANVDKMIMKNVQAMPHGLFNTPQLVGEKGERLLEYVKWVRKRILDKGKGDYEPTILLGTYGTIGMVFKNDIPRIAGYISKLEEAADPYPLWIETPVLAESSDKQLEMFKNLRKSLKTMGSSAKIIVDEWCTTLEDIKRYSDAHATDIINIMTPQLGGINNAIEAVLYCKKKGIGAYIAGSCNETDKSAQVSTHIALATQADLVAAKPGMGVDEGIMIVFNEMQRTLAILKSRAQSI